MENFTTISERVKLFIEHKGITVNKFSDNVGTSNSYFNKLIKNNTTIGSDKIESILRAYPEINPEWLIIGSGNMLKNQNIDIVLENNTNNSLCKKENEILKMNIKVHEETINMLREKIEFLNEKIEFLKKDINLH